MATSSSNVTNSSRTQGHRPPAIAQALITTLLRSPLHGVLSNNLLLLTFTGRKSGKQFTTPVTYSRLSDGRLLVFSTNAWWRNLVGGAPVSMLLKGRVVQGTADVDTSHAAVLQETRAYLDRKGVRNARMIGLSINTKREPTPEELDAATQGRVVIYIQPRA